MANDGGDGDGDGPAAALSALSRERPACLSWRRWHPWAAGARGLGAQALNLSALVAGAECRQPPTRAKPARVRQNNGFRYELSPRLAPHKHAAKRSRALSRLIVSRARLIDELS
jgi:hypothetical protein